MSSKQLEKLSELGVEVNRGDINKGRASDIIGLFYPTDDEDRTKLKFFGVPLKGMTQSRARHELAQLFKLSSNREKWENRPANALDCEFFKYFEIAVPKSLTKREADILRSEKEDELENSHPSRMRDWEHFESLYEDFLDKEFRKDYDLKVVSITAFKKSVLALMKEGAVFHELDSGEIAEKIYDTAPNLVRGS